MTGAVRIAEPTTVWARLTRAVFEPCHAAGRRTSGAEPAVRHGHTTRCLVGRGMGPDAEARFRHHDTWPNAGGPNRGARSVVWRV